MNLSMLGGERMGIENLALTFDNPAGVFYAGQVVSGTVRFVFTKTYESDGVFVKFSGMSEVHWTEQTTRHAGTCVKTF